MEKTVEIIIWSDNSELEQIANIIHDHGYHTAEIRKEELGKHENACNWSWCKANMIDSVCVDLFHHIGEIVPTENVEEMPLFRYVALLFSSPLSGTFFNQIEISSIRTSRGKGFRPLYRGLFSISVPAKPQPVCSRKRIRGGDEGIASSGTLLRR